jgi:hypothetical protein
MSIVDDKREVFGQIAALRTLNEGFPDIKLTDSFPSLNNNASTLDFIIDLLKSLIGFEELKNEVVDIITYNLNDIEIEIKKALKLELKSIVSCGVDPSLPSFLLYGSGTPITIKIDKIDFLNIMKVNPTSDEGIFIYDDIAGGVNSLDFNTYLYYTIQGGDDNETFWGSQSLSDDIFSFTYDEDNGTNTNVLKITASPYYSNPANGKKLTDLNNDYIDSISIFGSDKMIYNIIDGLFGTLASAFNKSQRQLVEEEKINQIIQNIIESDDDATITDNFFTFSNPEIQAIQNNAKNRKQGIRVLENCENVESSVSLNALQNLNDGLTAATTTSEKREVISNSLDNMADASAGNENNVKDRFTIKLNFIELLIRRLMISIANFIVSPKIIMIFLINYKIIYGISEEYDDASDFLKQNRELIRSITQKIRDIIIKILLEKALKEISLLVAQSLLKNKIEKANNNIAQLLSLVGAPVDVIRLITNLS